MALRSTRSVSLHICKMCPLVLIAKQMYLSFSSYSNSRKWIPVSSTKYGTLSRLRVLHQPTALNRLWEESCSYLHFFPVALRPNAGHGLSFLRFLDHIQRRITVGRTPLDEWSARRRDLYLTTHNTDNRQTSMPPVGFEPTISAGERPQTYALDCAATGTG